METKIDEWWAKSGRASFIARVQAAVTDSKVAHILQTEKDKAKLEERLKDRVDADVLPFLLS